MNNELKLVEFERFCPKCVHNTEIETEDPCDECIANGYSETGPIPVNYKEKK